MLSTHATTMAAADPYIVLGLAPSADDAQIKNAWLDKVKQFVPEHHPQQFQQIQTAYQQIKDESSRMLYQLLKVPTFDLQLIMQQSLSEPNQRRPQVSQLLSLLENSVSEHAF